MKFEKYLSTLDADELKELYNQILHADPILLEKIKHAIALSDKFYSKRCAVCGTPLSIVKEPIVLEFGPRDFRKRAAFCGADCLQYFIKKVIILKENNVKQHSKKNKRRRKKKSLFRALFSL